MDINALAQDIQSSLYVNNTERGIVEQEQAPEPVVSRYQAYNWKNVRKNLRSGTVSDLQSALGLKKKEAKTVIIQRMVIIYSTYVPENEEDDDDESKITGVKYSWEYMDRVALSEMIFLQIITPTIARVINRHVMVNDRFFGGTNPFAEDGVKPAFHGVTKTRDVLRVVMFCGNSSVSSRNKSISSDPRVTKFISEWADVCDQTKVEFLDAYQLVLNIALAFMATQNPFVQEFPEAKDGDPYVSNLTPEQVYSYTEFYKDEQGFIFFVRELVVEIFSEIWNTLTPQEKEVVAFKISIAIRMISEEMERLQRRVNLIEKLQIGFKKGRDQLMSAVRRE